MSAQNIKPEAVAPADAQSILAAVNGAVTRRRSRRRSSCRTSRTSALRSRRTSSSGAPSSVAASRGLDQLLTVELLGPVRFSRVVRAILGQVEGLILPQDVAEADAKKILDFLNGAETAQALADGIELPNEPDVGLRLGAHILERRTELEGGFTSLDQILTVKLIGPVRFTRIVRAILGVPGVGRDEFDDLAAQVRALQDALAAAPPRVVVSQVEPQRYLGQPMTIVATVTGANGLPVGGVPVTLSASWGRLRGSDGFSIQEGGNVSFRASGDGTVRVTLLPPTSEDLEHPQQDAVETALGGLDPAAATPRDAADALDGARSRSTSSRQTTISAAASTSTSAISASTSSRASTTATSSSRGRRSTRRSSRTSTSSATTERPTPASSPRVRSSSMSATGSAPGSRRTSTWRVRRA